MGLSEVAFPHALATRVALAWGVVTDPLWGHRTGRDPLASDCSPVTPATQLAHLDFRHSPVPPAWGCAGALHWAGRAVLTLARCSSPLLVQLLVFHRTPSDRATAGRIAPLCLVGSAACIHADRVEADPAQPGVASRRSSPWEKPILSYCLPKSCRLIPWRHACPRGQFRHGLVDFP